MLAGKQILIVDDNEANLILARLILEKQHAKVIMAWNGIEAVPLALGYNFDLILLDLNMPELDGFGTCAAIRTFNFDVPIIAITANTLSGEKEKCFECGMNGFLAKPYSEEELLSEIGKLLRLEVPKLQKGISILDHVKLYDLKNVIQIGGGKPGFVENITAVFLKDIEQAAVDMDHAINSKDYESIRQTAHKLKSTLEIFSVPFLSEIRVLEQLAMSKGPQDKMRQLVTSFMELKEKILAESNSS